MEVGAFADVVWCDLEIVLLKIHSSSPWDTKMVRTCEAPDLAKPTVNVYVCHEDDAIFNEATTYREKIMRQGSYRGHTFGRPAKLEQTRLRELMERPLGRRKGRASDDSQAWVAYVP